MSILDSLAIKYGTDKSSRFHNYIKLYEKYFESIRFKSLNILEIGVQYGQSMKMWIEYFPNSILTGFDIDLNCWKSDNLRCKIIVGDQENEKDLRLLANERGPFDIIIDDGGHTMLGQQLSCSILFEYLKDNGIYVIEDLHTCFMKDPVYKQKLNVSTYKYLEDRVQDLQLSGKGDYNAFCADKNIHLDRMAVRPTLNNWENNLSYVHHYRSIVFMGKNTNFSTAIIPVSSSSSNTISMYIDCVCKSILNWYFLPTSLSHPGYNEKFSNYDITHGTKWPDNGYSMIGLNAMKNVQYCLESILSNKIEGDLVEAGVWRGGSSIFMRAILKAYGDQSRKVFVCDSFEGLPPPDPKYIADANDWLHTVSYLAVDIDSVKSNFVRFDLSDDNNVFVKGWFKDTLGDLQTNKIALLRLDGDMYSSTMETLVPLYNKVSVGGFILVDDYGLNACKLAVDDFRRDNGITDPIICVSDTKKVYWQKSC